MHTMMMKLTQFLIFAGLVDLSVGLPGIVDELRDYEIVSPREYKHASNSGNKEYIIPTKEDTFHVVLAEQQTLVSDNFRLFLTHEDRTPTHRYMVGIKNCHYHGTLKNGSGNVVMSTCGGLRGSIHVGNDKIYFIEPTGKNSDHIFYSYEDIVPKKVYYDKPTEVDDASKNTKFHSSQHSSSRERRDISSHVQYVPMSLVVDHAMYNKLNQDIAQVNVYVLSMINYSNYIYKMVNLKIVVTNIEIWSDQDQIDVSLTNAYTTLHNFHVYHRDVLITGKNWLDHHNAQLLSGVSLNGLIGLALTGPLCQRQSEALVVAWSLNPYSVAGTVGHELGHNMGLYHDEIFGTLLLDNELMKLTWDATTTGGSCNCPTTNCAMSAYAGNLVLGWSNCSKDALKERMENGYLTCLTDTPNQAFLKSCGNGFVEDGEDCDCGPHDLCSNTCCDATICKLTTNAQCAHGKCCNVSTCTFIEAGTTCREKEGDCDLVDTCTGDNGKCDDVTLPDFHGCNYNMSYCYQGVCARTHAEQCKYLWGPNANYSDTVCVPSGSVINPSEFANCGQLIDGSYAACRNRDIPCGRLQCHGNNLPTFPLVGSNRRIYPYSDGTNTCKAVSMYTYDASSPTYVQDGAKCGQNEVCFEYRCLDRASLQVPECDDRCESGKGICTNMDVCFCYPSYGGLNCSEVDVSNVQGRPYYPCDNKCMNGGTCSDQKCNCPAGRACPYCEQINPLNTVGQQCDGQINSVPQSQTLDYHCDEYAFGDSFVRSGCHHKVSDNDTTFQMLANYRSDIVWNDFTVTTKRMLCECAQIAKIGGYKIFGIQFYGECWASKLNTTTASTSATDCVNTAYTGCAPTDALCVGDIHGVFLYYLTD